MNQNKREIKIHSRDNKYHATWLTELITVYQHFHQAVLVFQLTEKKG